jgi:acyl-CoA dehydrogenase
MVPRVLPDGTRNQLRIDRLKDKLGTRAMATAEVHLEGALAHLVGDLDHGFAQMTSMLTITRLHNAIASAATMRRAVMLASAYAAQRTAFGRMLDQHPLQREVLGQMAVHAEAALTLTMRIAELLGCLEAKDARPEEEMLLRLGTSLAKAYTARRAVAIASEAVEAFGGVGYMEDTGIPRLLRDAQVLPIWEGTTNVLSLDAWRVLQRPGCIEALDLELARLDTAGRTELLDELGLALRDQADGLAQANARWWQERISEAWIGGLLRSRARLAARETALAERWERRAEAPVARPGDLELILGEPGSARS